MIRILIALIAFSSPCLAQGPERSFIRVVGEYSFRIPSPTFFYRLHMQFCAKATTDTCKDNLRDLQRGWVSFDSMLQSDERQMRDKPLVYIDMDYAAKRFDELNAQNIRFVETEGKSILLESMQPKILGQ